MNDRLLFPTIYFAPYNFASRKAEHNIHATEKSQSPKAISSIRRLTMDMIKVYATSRTAVVAGAIAKIIREHKHAEIQAVGAAAINQAVKDPD